MTSKIMVDSSVLIEYRKGVQLEFLETMTSDSKTSLFINQTVLSEYLFHHLAIYGGKAPLTIKSNKGILSIFQQKPPYPFLHLFQWLPDDDKMPQEAIRLMENYNLLPNDALILASCKQNKIKALASYDADFAPACQAEGIAWLQTVSDFEMFKKTL